MKKKKKKFIEYTQCDICGYKNNPDFLQYSGVCHCCGKILDDKAYFKAQMNKKMRLWRDKKFDRW